jgi:hypothetical protein
MGQNELFTRFGLAPVAADLPEIRQLIESMIVDDAREQRLKLLCIQLFSARKRRFSHLQSQDVVFRYRFFISTLNSFARSGLSPPKRSSIIWGQQFADDEPWARELRFRPGKKSATGRLAGAKLSEIVSMVGEESMGSIKRRLISNDNLRRVLASKAMRQCRNAVRRKLARTGN